MGDKSFTPSKCFQKAKHTIRNALHVSLVPSLWIRYFVVTPQMVKFIAKVAMPKISELKAMGLDVELLSCNAEICK